MKKLLTIIFMAVSTAALAQYPLPATQVLGNLTIPNDSVAMGKAVPSYVLDVSGESRISSNSDSSGIFVGSYADTLFPGTANIPVAVSGAGSFEKVGLWRFLNFTGADNLNNKLGATMLGLDLRTGEYRNIRMDSTSIWLTVGNVTQGHSRTSAQLTEDDLIRFQLSASTATFDVLDTNGANLFRVKENGNVGIGTATPAYRLQVAGVGYIDTVVTDLFQYLDNGSGSNGNVLTRATDGVAHWQAPASRVLSQDVGSTTTTTDWETLGTYTIAANTLGDDSSTDIAFAMSCTESTDSVLVLFGADTCLFDRANATNGYVANITAYYESAGTIVYANTTEQKVYTGTEDNSGTIAVTFKAKSATIGNQKLEYYRIKLE